MANVSSGYFEAETVDSAKKDLLLAPESDGLLSGWSPRKLSATDQPKSPARRKLSESRGVNLPDIKLHPEAVTMVRAENNAESPLLTASPLRPFNRPPFNERQSPRTTAHRLTEIIDICIYMPDHKGFVFKVDGGRSATAAQLLRLVYEEQGIKDYEKADQLFALWMCSPLLEVQLKPHHCPFSIRLQWRWMLRRFTSASDEAQAIDEPVVVIRRNVYLSKRRQLQLLHVNDPETEILFRDTKECIMNGSYFCPLDICLQLAAYDMVLSTGPYSPSTHTPYFVRNNLEERMPPYHTGSVKGFSFFGLSIPALGCRGVENQVMDLYKTASSLSPAELKWEYLTACMNLPVYGAAFFRGYVERTATFGSSYTPVVVAINREYLSLLDPSKFTALLTLPVESCSWQKISVPTEAELLLPSFYVHFPEMENDIATSRTTGGVKEDDGNENGRSRLVQIFSKQSVMMDALLNSSIQIRAQEMGASAKDISQDEAAPEIETGATELRLFTASEPLRTDQTAESRIITSDPMYKSKLSRLCTASIDASGRCVEAKGLLKTILDEPRHSI